MQHAACKRLIACDIGVITPSAFAEGMDSKYTGCWPNGTFGGMYMRNRGLEPHQYQETLSRGGFSISMSQALNHGNTAENSKLTDLANKTTTLIATESGNISSRAEILPIYYQGLISLILCTRKLIESVCLRQKYADLLKHVELKELSQAICAQIITSLFRSRDNQSALLIAFVNKQYEVLARLKSMVFREFENLFEINSFIDLIHEQMLNRRYAG